MKTKLCLYCKKRKVIDEFHKNKVCKDGYHYYCKKCCKAYKIEYYKNPINKKKVLKDCKKYRSTNKYKTKRKQYVDKNRKHILKLQKIWYQNNKLYSQKRNNNRSRVRYKNDVNFKLAITLRNRLLKVLNGINKSKSTIKLLGCSVEQFKKHLESQFKLGMTWKNHTVKGWHIDHIKPCFKFDLSKSSEQRKCFHYTNMQPLWAEENLQKQRKDRKNEL